MYSKYGDTAMKNTDSDVKKVTWKPGTMIYPLPAVMVSCGTMEKPNIMTAAWTGTINSEPSMCYISVRKERFSHGIISESGCFVINLVNEQLCRAADFCGVRSGRDIDKVAFLNLKMTESSVVSAPMIAASPVNIECRIVNTVELGSHDMFIAKVEAVNVSDEYIDSSGSLRLDKANLIAYSHGEYRLLGKKIGRFGFSVQKKKSVRR